MAQKGHVRSVTNGPGSTRSPPATCRTGAHSDWRSRAAAGRTDHSDRETAQLVGRSRWLRALACAAADELGGEDQVGTVAPAQRSHHLARTALTWSFSCGAGGVRTRDREIMSTRRLSAVPLSAPGVFLVSAAQRVLCCRGSRPAALACAGPPGQLLVQCEGRPSSTLAEYRYRSDASAGRRSGRARRSQMRVPYRVYASKRGERPRIGVAGAACQGTGPVEADREEQAQPIVRKVASHVRRASGAG